MDATRHEEVLRCLFRESNDAFFLFDPSDLRVVDVNPAALRLTGFERKAALGLRVTDLFSSEVPQGVERLIEAYRKTGVFHSREDYSLKRAQGDAIAVNISASRIHTKPEPLGLVVARDISERRNAQEVLERFFRLSPAIFGILSAGGRLVKVNRACETILGYSPDELLSADPLSLVHPDDRQTAAPAFAGGAEGVSGLEVRFRHKDGGDRWLSLSSVRADEDRYVVALDVSAAKEAAALRLAKEAAEAANRAKGQFLSNMSHELRTPLTAILALIDVFVADPSCRALAHDRFADLETIKKNGEHLLQLINDSLDLAKMEAGKLGVESGPCDPGRIVDEVARMMRPRAEAKGLSLIVEHATPIPSLIHSDPVRLRQILINLVANAVQFTGSGSVTIRAGVHRGPSSAPELRIEVADTGVGLTADEAASLFRPFHQVGDARGRPRGGSGLGLAISRRLAEALSGSIAVRSQPGTGSTFTLSLPLREPSSLATVLDRPPLPSAAPEGPPAAPMPGPTGTRSRSVLLVEDNADNRRAIGLLLELAGLDVATASNGQEALDLCARGRTFDVILMDMQMPVVDGFAATRQLRQDGYDRPIIALTAFAMDEDREECLRIGCDAHISKPVDWQKLLVLIEQLTGRIGRRNDPVVDARSQRG